MSHSPVLADSIELYSDCMANQSISTAREKNHESLGEPDLSAVKPAYFNNSMKKWITKPYYEVHSVSMTMENKA